MWRTNIIHLRKADNVSLFLPKTEQQQQGVSTTLHTRWDLHRGLSCSSWIRRAQIHTQLLPARNKRFALQKVGRSKRPHDQSCTKGAPTFPELFYASGYSLKKVTEVPLLGPAPHMPCVTIIRRRQVALPFSAIKPNPSLELQKQPLGQ